MRNHESILLEVYDNYSEWFEQVGEDNSPSLMIHILSQMLVKEKELKEYYQRRVNHVCTNSTN